MALESICTLLGENATDWKAIRGVIIRDNFISTIVNFDADDISDHVREQMKVRIFLCFFFSFGFPNYFKFGVGPKKQDFWPKTNMFNGNICTLVNTTKNDS